VGDREILEIYLNSASKNTPETDIFPHGTKSLLTSVISQQSWPNFQCLISATCLHAVRKTTTHLSRNSPSADLDCNPEPPQSWALEWHFSCYIVRN